MSRPQAVPERTVGWAAVSSQADEPQLMLIALAPGVLGGAKARIHSEA
jgi:hypothetical protein